MHRLLTQTGTDALASRTRSSAPKFSSRYCCLHSPSCWPLLCGHIAVRPAHFARADLEREDCSCSRLRVESVSAVAFPVENVSNVTAGYRPRNRLRDRTFKKCVAQSPGECSGGRSCCLCCRDTKSACFPRFCPHLVSPSSVTRTDPHPRARAFADL